MKDMVEIVKEKDGCSPMSCSSDGAYYPWGTELQLGTKLIDELGIAELATTDVVEIKAVGFVNNKSENSYADGEASKSISIQITGLKIKRKTEEEDPVKILYKG